MLAETPPNDQPSSGVDEESGDEDDRDEGDSEMRDDGSEKEFNMKEEMSFHQMCQNMLKN